MKKHFKLLFIYLFFFIPVIAQKHDNVWLFGYSSNSFEIEHGGTTIDFSALPPDTYYEYRSIEFFSTNSSICDSAGNLLFSTNGIFIANALGEEMENGSGINPGSYANDNPRGYLLWQGAIAIPRPDSEYIYDIVHTNLEYPQNELGLHTSKLYYTKIDMSQAGGLGAVVEKNSVIIEDILEPGKLTACKHANGRDWWLFTRRYNSNEYYLISQTSLGFENKGIQILGDSILSPGLGQAVFSPDGTKFVEFSIDNSGEKNFLSIYKFDRCTGELSYPVQLIHTDTAFSGGVAISANSRFLYVSSFLRVHQYDLWAEDIEASKDTVAIWDGFMVPPVFATTFFLAQLAPDNKIYISSSNSVPYLHVINNPDLPGELCDVCQHCVLLPTWNAFSMPNFPNYRLGALDGSPCDTLRQPPTAAWSYEAQYPEVAFQDASFHDIRVWHWDFGDGVTDTVPHPVHSYTANGVYNVCLTVSNPRGVDTLCREIQVIVNDAGEVKGGISASISPNPVVGNIALLRLQALVRLEQADVIFRDVLGREVFRESLQVVNGQASQELKIGHLATGGYFCTIESNGIAIWQSKIIKP